MEVAGGEVGEGLVFEVTDDELDDGVLAVLGFDDRERFGSVGREREVLPAGQQFALGVEGAHAAHDQALVAEHGLGDLRDARRRVVGERLPAGSSMCSIAARTCGCRRTPIEYCQPALARRAKTLVDQNPESARSSFGPVAPARVTRAISSSQKRSIPREVFAEPFLSRMCRTAPVSAREATIG